MCCHQFVFSEKTSSHTRPQRETVADKGNKESTGTTEENNYTTHSYIYIFFLKEFIIVWAVSSIDSTISTLAIKYFISEELHAFITSQQH